MLEISKLLLDQIAAEGEKSYPNECCGFIIGELVTAEHKIAQRIIPCENEFSEEEQFHRFLIEPREMLKVQRDAAKEGLDIVGFYHSHPDCRAKPSEYDRTHALPVYSYIITSIINGAQEETVSWQLDENNAFRLEMFDIKEYN